MSTITYFSSIVRLSILTITLYGSFFIIFNWNNWSAWIVNPKRTKLVHISCLVQQNTKKKTYLSKVSLWIEFLFQTLLVCWKHQTLLDLAMVYLHDFFFLLAFDNFCMLVEGSHVESSLLGHLFNEVTIIRVPGCAVMYVWMQGVLCGFRHNVV